MMSRSICLVHDYINSSTSVMISKFLRRTLWTRHSLISNGPRFFSTRVLDEESSFGNYSVILPKEPFVWGVSHISPRPVPSNIRRPPYARTRAEDQHTLHASTEHSREPYKDDNRIRLGSEEETKLRASSKLARKVREFAGTLVRVGTILTVVDGRHTDPIFIARNNHEFHRRGDP